MRGFFDCAQNDVFGRVMPVVILSNAKMSILSSPKGTRYLY